MQDADDSTGAAGSPPAGPVPLPTTGVRCLQGGCERIDVAQCSFVDRYERRCATRWCPDHSLASGRGIHCRRHAAVAEVLTGPQIPGSLPELENRAPSLVNYVARAIDAEVHALLQPHAAPGESLAVEPVHVAVGTRARRWEHAWAVRTATGHDRLRVAVEVDDHRDPELALRVGQDVVSRSIPPWIDHRLRNDDIDERRSATERTAYYAALVDLIRQSLPQGA
ncbi:MAG: hypothetical protein ABR541_03000 [Candidatus Dormibacteria bacterium]